MKRSASSRELETQRTELQARRDALQADPAMRDAERLDQLRQDADRKEKAAKDRESDENRQASQVQKYDGKAAQAARRAGTGRDKLAQALHEAATALGRRTLRPAAPDGRRGTRRLGLKAARPGCLPC